VTFTATVSPSTLVIDRYDWDFGDGHTSFGSSNTIPHTYTLDPDVATSVTFTVQVTAFKASDGTSTSSQVNVTIQPI
jgi:hypothetical protein